MVIEQSEVFLDPTLDVKGGVREIHLFSIENNKTLYWEFVRSLKVYVLTVRSNLAPCL